MKDSDLTVHKLEGEHNWSLIYQDGKAIKECSICGFKEEDLSNDYFEVTCSGISSTTKTTNSGTSWTYIPGSNTINKNGHCFNMKDITS